MNVKISIYVICVKAILYLLLHNLRDCTFNLNIGLVNKFRNWNEIYVSWAVTPTASEFRFSDNFPFEILYNFSWYFFLFFFISNKKYIARI